MKTKIIKDLAYGYIEIDEEVAEIIDHRSFQRLKNISQLTAHHLYPSANHTRFEHSLGVMHLSMKFMNVLEIKFKELGISPDEIKYDRMHLKYASLLHDVGHAPLSHVGEAYYDKKEILNKLELLFGSNQKYCYDKGSLHELMSCYIIIKNYKKMLESIFTKNSTKLDLGYIFRIITGSTYNDNHWNQNIIIEVVNSNSIDVDKIDYLIRDNLMAGGVAPEINLERLLYSITIDSMKKIAYSPVGISSVVSVIDSRDFLYLWIYNHHIVVYTDFLYKTAIEHLSNEKNTKSKYKILLSDYFSCDAISNSYVTDDDIKVILNKEYSNTKSIYSKKILSQLLERKFLKPIWKTIFEFNNFMSENFDSRQMKAILNLIENNNLSNITSELIQKCKVEKGDLFIIGRSNKFYAMSKKTEFYINFPDGNDIELSNIMPERKFDEKYSNVAFYVFTLPKNIDVAKQKLVEILKDRLTQ